MIPWPFIAGAVGVFTLVGSASLVSFTAGKRAERLVWLEAQSAAAEAGDKEARDRFDALSAALADLAARDAKAEADRVKAMEGLKRAIINNRPPADGCRIDAAAAERLRNVVEAANAGRGERGGSGTGGDQGGAATVRGPR